MTRKNTLILACELSGLGLLSAGLWLMWPPLALVVTGALLLTAGVAGALR